MCECMSSVLSDWTAALRLDAWLPGWRAGSSGWSLGRRSSEDSELGRRVDERSSREGEARDDGSGWRLMRKAGQMIKYVRITLSRARKQADSRGRG